MSSVLRRAILSFMVLLIGLTLVPAGAQAAAGWEWSAPSPQGEELLSVAYGDGQFV
ncbi:MAG: hypothetical protein K0R39_4953, partial [Symbiobacteriaceae bacterium]|nr:hypothetical protein [Symbiobacteriaceae bacterium]